MRNRTVLALRLLASVTLATAADAQVTPCPPPATFDQLVQDLVPLAQPTGEKDLANNLAAMRFGWILWDTGEEHAGYNGMLAEFGGGSNFYTQACGSWSLSACDAQLLFPAEIDAQLKPPLFTAPWAKFDTAGLNPDDTLAFAAAGIDFFSVQNTVFSPVKSTTPICGGSWSPYNYPRLAAWAGGHSMSFVQNIGFANNPLFAIGEFDFAWTYPLIDRANKRHFNLAPVTEVLPSQTQLLVNPPPSMLPFEAASCLVASIQERVLAFSESRCPYQIVGGEHAFGLYLEDMPFLYADQACGDCSNCDNPSDPADLAACNCANCIAFKEFYDKLLPLTDYSPESDAHLHAWLEQRRYPGPSGLADLKTAWNTPSYVQFSDADPLALPLSPPPNYQTVYDDWVAFQDEQYTIESRDFQYRAAKETRPSQAMYNWSGGPRGHELSALQSDGIASGEWYVDNSAALSLPSPMKRVAAHALATGESLNCPLFGMPRADTSSGAGPCDPTSHPCWTAYDPSIPCTYAPPCFDDAFARRTLREFLALGVDSLALGYWENLTSWSHHLGTGYDLAKSLAAEVKSWRVGRSGSSPWHSPLLVHTGSPSYAGTPTPAYAALTRSTLDVLAREQVQYAAFGEEQALDDLWLRSGRELLFSAFADDLDWTHMLRLRDVAVAESLHLIVMCDLAKGQALDAEQPLTTLGTPTIVPGIVVKYPLSPSGGDRRELWVWLTDPEPILDQYLLDPQVLPATVRSHQPVTASGSGAPDTLDVTVGCDGLGFLVAVTNTDATTTQQTVQLAVQVAPAPPLCGWNALDLAAFTLQQGEAKLVRIRPNLAGLASYPQGQINTAVTAAQNSIAALRNAGYDTRAASNLIGHLVAAKNASDREKVAGLLVRLRRMVIGKWNATTSKLSLVHWDGSPLVLGEALVQREFVYQRHAVPKNVSGGLVLESSDALGQVTIVRTPPANAPSVWDFLGLAYVVPVDALGNGLVEAQIRHATLGTQTAVLCP